MLCNDDDSGTRQMTAGGVKVRPLFWISANFFANTFWTVVKVSVFMLWPMHAGGWISPSGDPLNNGWSCPIIGILRPFIKYWWEAYFTYRCIVSAVFQPGKMWDIRIESGSFQVLHYAIVEIGYLYVSNKWVCGAFWWKFVPGRPRLASFVGRSGPTATSVIETKTLFHFYAMAFSECTFPANFKVNFVQ